MSNKVYQNVSIQQLTDWSATNPYRNHSLAPIKIQTGDPGHQGTSLGSIGLPAYSAIPLEDMLHVFEWMRNPLFADASVGVRSSLVRTLTTTFQTEVDTLLAGSPYARKRRRIYDGVGAILHGTPLKDEDRSDVIGALAHLSGIQLLLVKQPTTVEPTIVTDRDGSTSTAVAIAAIAVQAVTELPTVTFSSSPVNWSPSVPTWVVDWHGRWVGSCVEGDSNMKDLLEWCLALDPLKWHVQWPVVDATKDVIVQELSTTASWKATDTKLKKDVLALRLGRVRVLRTLDL